MVKVYFIFLALLAILFGYFNRPQEENIVEEPPITYIEIEAVGYCKRPGVYEIPQNTAKDKVLELLGADENAIYSDFEVTDGAYIEFYEPPTDPIIISSATYEELDSLPGIGEAKANKILEYLETNKVFQTWDEFFDLVAIKNEEAKLNIKLKAVLR